MANPEVINSKGKAFKETRIEELQACLVPTN